MRSHYYILTLIPIFLGCNKNCCQQEKEYIENLEKKNAILERELKTLESEPKITKKNTELQRELEEKQVETETTDRAQRQIRKNYFTIGSTEEEVVNVMGEPSSYITSTPEAKMFRYGLSSVNFYKGKVISYDNFDGNLKVRIGK